MTLVSFGRAKSSVLAFLAAASVTATALPHASANPDDERAASPTAVAPGREGRADDPYFDVVTEQGQHARGLYFNGMWAGRLGAEGIMDQLRQAGLDAAVIDVRNDRGQVFIPTGVTNFQRNVAPMTHALRDVVATLKQNGIYTIARLVCFNDPRTSRSHPELAVADSRPENKGKPWISRSGNSWLDPTNPTNHQMIRDFAVETAATGFDEIQLDYVRFPVDANARYARFRGLQPATPRWTYVDSMLTMIDEAIHIPLSTDIFGIAALRHGDPDGLGQLPEEWSKHVEIFSPMLYANNFRSWRSRDGSDAGEDFIRTALTILRPRIPANSVVRPYLQAFPMGASRPYGEQMIAGQIAAARQRQADGFLFWNPGSSYGAVLRGMHVRGASDPFDWRTHPAH